MLERLWRALLVDPDGTSEYQAAQAGWSQRDRDVVDKHILNVVEVTGQVIQCANACDTVCMDQWTRDLGDCVAALRAVTP